MKHHLGNPQRSPIQRAVAIAAVVILLNGVLYLPPIYRFIGADAVLWINNLTNIAAGLICAWLGFRLWQSFGRGESQRIIWGSLTIGLVLWIIGEIIWVSYPLFLDGSVPPNSPADVAWILGYIAVIVGLVLRIRTLRMRLTRPWQFAALAAFGILGLIVIIYMIIPSLNDTQGTVSYQKIIDLLYPVFDLLMAFLAFFLVLVLEGGMLSKPWAIIALGCFCIAISDLLYAFAASHGMYQIDPAAGLDLLSYGVNLSYTFAYVLTALGLYQQARLLDAI